MVAEGAMDGTRIAGVLLLLWSVHSISEALEMVTQSCDLFTQYNLSGSHRLANTVIWYNFLSARNVTDDVISVLEYEEKFAQLNHICGAKSAVIHQRAKILIEQLQSCRCRDIDSNKTDCFTCRATESTAHQLTDLQGRIDYFDGFKNTTRLFIGDSRISVDARVYTHMLNRKSIEMDDKSVRLSQNYSSNFRRTNFAAYSESLDAWSIYIRDQHLARDWRSIKAEILDLAYDTDVEGSRHPKLESGFEIIFGGFVWEVIGRDNQVGTENRTKGVVNFLHSSIESTPIQKLILQVRNAFPNTTFILRSVLPVNPNPKHDKIEGPLNGKAAMVINAVSAWYTEERNFAERNDVEFLDAAKIFSEMRVQLGLKVHELYVDVWHPRGSVTALYIPFILAMKVFRQEKSIWVSH